MSERTVPRLRFKKDFDFKPSSRSTVGYKAGWEGPVSQACYDTAIAARVAEDAAAPRNSTKPADA